jgi:UDP-2,3-diacylglucosamine hydrolase
VAFYFVSDIHLRGDRPEQDAAFRGWLNRLAKGDDLVILGDLCDFWMGARATADELLRSQSLQALAAFTHAGGSLAIMAGNHDLWLCPFYERRLGARIITEPHNLEAHGLRVHLVHGHRLGARRVWKSWMESRAFFGAFGRLPHPLAHGLDRLLARRNLHDLEADEERHLRVFRAYAEKCRGACDIVLFGHVHRALDVPHASPRLIVLGGWQRRAGSLKIDSSGACFQIEHEGAPATAGMPAPSRVSSPAVSTLHEN